MKNTTPDLFAFAAFNDESRRCGIRVRRVAVVQIFNGLDCAAVEFRSAARPVGRIVGFNRLSRKPSGLREKIRTAFAFNLSLVRPGFPAVL